MRINVGPIHPSTHGVLRLVVDVDGDTIKNVETHIGFLHRGVEKLMETRMYMQSPSYVEKLDYAAPLGWEDLYVAAVEKALGIEMKEYAQQAMTILLEFQRIASHLLWLGTFCNDLGQFYTMFMWTFRERAKVIKFLEDVTGSRMFYVNRRLGGLNRKIPEDFKEQASGLLDYLEKNIRSYVNVLDKNPIFIERTKGIGILDAGDAIEYGVTGPVLRGSGVYEDVRRSSPYYYYAKVHFNVPKGSSGDVFDRYKVRFEEMLESISIIRQVLNMMPDSGDLLGLPVKLIGPSPTASEVMVKRELSRGEGLIYMIPDKQKPYRISLRSPAFINLSVLPKIAEGQKFADLFSILGSLDVVMAEIDR
ncbi:MAG: NADH-quinone oxidoreductase subunit D [Candidatus Micrarchaeia archaeon]